MLRRRRPEQRWMTGMHRSRASSLRLVTKTDESTEIPITRTAAKLSAAERPPTQTGRAFMRCLARSYSIYG